MKFYLIVLSLLILPAITVVAHGPVHESIKRVTKEIKKNPKNPKLYVERGQYYQVDENFDLALNDFLTARTLDPKDVMIDYHCGKLFSEHGYPTTAKRFANKFLSYNEEHVAGLMLRASIYVQLKEDSLAILDYERGIKNTRTPKPEYFVNISKASIAADSTDFNSAIHWLEMGEKYLGFNIALKTYAYDLAMKMEQHKKAIEIVDSVLPKLNRKESWLYKKGMAFESAKNNQKAKETYQETIDLIRKLPKRFQKTKMMLELEANTQMALIRLK